MTTTPAGATPTPTPELYGLASGPLRFGAEGGVSVLAARGGPGKWARVFGGDTFGPFAPRIALADARNGWAVDHGVDGGNSRIFRTSDGGTSWSSQTENVTPVDGSVDLADIVAVSGAHAVAVGALVPPSHVALEARPLVLVTHDGGDSWTRSPLRVDPDRPGALTSACFFDERTGVAVGWSAVSGPVMLWTIDGGDFWGEATGSIASAAVLSSVSCASSRAVFVAGTGIREGHPGPAVLFSVDFGSSWGFRPFGGAHAFDRAPPKIAFVDPFQGWAILENTLTILHTEDAGLSWTEQRVPLGLRGSFTALAFRDARHGVVVGADESGGNAPPVALILVTEDGGTTWQRAAADPSDALALTDVSLVP